MFSMPRRGRAGAAAATALVIAALTATACSSSSSSSAAAPVASAAGSSAASPSAAAAMTTVTVGIGPFLDNQTLPLAQELGFAAQQGITFKFTTLPSNDAIYQAIESGQLDLGAGTLRGLVPLASTAPTLRNYIIRDQFLGFFLVGRKSANPPAYSALIAKGVTPAQAKLDVLKSWVGKTFDIVGEQNFAPIAAGLAAVGISPKSVHVDNFADDAKAAAAFQSGVGDYYTGSLPIQSALLLDHPADYVDVGGYQVLGPAGLSYDTWTTSDDWLTKNPQLALKVLAVVLKTSRYINADLTSAAPQLTQLVNTASSGDLPVAQVKLLATQFSDFLTPQQLESRVFATASPFYWQNEIKLDIQQSTPAPPTGYDPTSVADAQSWFTKLQADPQLMTWVNGPLS
jgi:ABC-type nitrate/sulfonate/bicarbonate transport system substrate-binding protein